MPSVDPALRTIRARRWGFEDKQWGPPQVFPVRDRRQVGLFTVEGELRAAIMPLFTFDPRNPKERPIGHGTTFRIDPWSRCVTAYHVVEDFLVLGRGQTLEIRPDLQLTALELEGIILGRVPLPPDAWRPIAQVFGHAVLDEPITGPRRLRNVSELAALSIPPSTPSREGTPYLPVDLGQWRPRIGERVLALGFADLDRDRDGHGPARPMQQYLYGSFGEITDIGPASPKRLRPWPLLRVSQEWPGGMSGGPLFNEAAHVVGVVSSGMGDIGSATFFSGWKFPLELFPNLDPRNPGWFLVYGVFDNEGALKGVARTLERVKEHAEESGLADVAPIALHPGDSSYLRIEPPEAAVRS